MAAVRDDSETFVDVPQHSSAMQQHQQAHKAEEVEEQQRLAPATSTFPRIDSSAAADSVGGTDGADERQQLAAGADVAASSVAITSVATETSVLATETSVVVTAEGQTRLTVVATSKPGRTTPESSDGTVHAEQQKRRREESKEAENVLPKRPRLP